MLSEQLLRIVAGVFVGIYIARYLGPELFGALSYVLAISAFILAVVRLGMDAVLVRDLVGEVERERLMGTAFWLMTAAALICYSLAGLTFWGMDEVGDVRLYLFIASVSAFFLPFLSIDYFYQSQLKSKYSACCKTVTLFFMSLVKLWLIYVEADLFSFVLASLFDHVLLAGLLLLIFYKGYGLSFLKNFSWKSAKEMLVSAWPMVLTAVASLIYMRIDQIMIRNMLGLYEVGIYSAAVKIYESWIVIPYIITVSLLPAIVKVKAGDEVIYKKRIAQLFGFVVWISILAAVVTCFLSEHLMVLAFGEAYRPSAAVVNIVMWTAVFASIGSVSARYFNVEKMERKIALRTLIAASMNVCLNWLLIPLYGIKGAAISTLFCTFFAHYLLDWFDRDLRILLQLKHQSLFILFKRVKESDDGF
ncbi:hypothetical protein PSEWESI4_04015 [Pseudomonas carbonaria]|uniref:Flippase n=2 Tax=Zestomonas carbonaria TaxID=2762745 RepID=A0A7U7ER99_9GAMM|nr:hypothetical protein PSEWESI4_04015 [Pseudomonas carbonaria]